MKTECLYPNVHDNDHALFLQEEIEESAFQDWHTQPEPFPENGHQCYERWEATDGIVLFL